MHSKKLLLRALRGETLPRPPFWLMRQAGRYLPEYRAIRQDAGSFLDLCMSPDLAVEVTLQPLRRYGMDAAILFSDILVVPHALGQRVEFREGVGPVLEPLSNARDLDRLSMQGLLECLAPVLETVRRLRGTLAVETALIGFAGAPWTVATYMVEGGSSRDYATVKRWAFGDPESFVRLIDLLIDATASYLIAQAKAGAEALQLFDTWAGVLPEPGIRRWSLEPIREIAKRIHAQYPEIPIIVFPRGVGPLYIEFARCSEFAAVSLDTSLPLAWAAEALQPHVTLQGNLDPIMVVTGGSPMRYEATRILDALGKGPFIFNLGHGIVPQTPPEHVAELANLVRDWSL